MEQSEQGSDTSSAVAPSGPVDTMGCWLQDSSFTRGAEDLAAHPEHVQNFTQPPITMGWYALHSVYGPLPVGGWDVGTSAVP